MAKVARRSVVGVGDAVVAAGVGGRGMLNRSKDRSRRMWTMKRESVRWMRRLNRKFARLRGPIGQSESQMIALGPASGIGRGNVDVRIRGRVRGSNETGVAMIAIESAMIAIVRNEVAWIVVWRTMNLGWMRIEAVDLGRVEIFPMEGIVREVVDRNEVVGMTGAVVVADRCRNSAG
jgi:hypothetical protein